jgi:tetratricopeptide (TPR) repeat protein
LELAPVFTVNTGRRRPQRSMDPCISIVACAFSFFSYWRPRGNSDRTQLFKNYSIYYKLNHMEASSNEPPPTADATSKEDWEIERDHAKQQGDQAFRMGGFKTAIDHYSQAIDLDPDFVLAYSNRSAAYLKNNEKSKALRDAEKVTELDPSLHKGWSRLAAALHALKRWPTAVEVYQKVLELDPSNAVAKKGLVDCQAEVDKAEALRRQFDEKVEETRTQEAVPEDRTNEEANDDGDSDDDDSLNGFFEEVEEVTKKKEPEPEAATNNVKNEKVVLGTAKDQMDRLLQSNFEWRNLNPYYVLQLPHVRHKHVNSLTRPPYCNHTSYSSCNPFLPLF